MPYKSVLSNLREGRVRKSSSIYNSDRKEEVNEITPKKVTQGNTTNGNEEFWGAKNAVDRDLFSRSGTSTRDGTGWLKLEFDKTYFIRDIRVYHKFYTGWYDPDDWCIESEDNFRKCVDKQSDVDVSIYQGEVKSKSCGTLQFKYGLEQSDQVYTIACNTAGDTVKFSKAIETLKIFDVVTKGTGN